MSSNQNQPNGMIGNIFACIFATLGILTIGTIFVPLAALIAIIGAINSLLTRHIASIGINILAWILIVVGFFSSPVLMVITGFTIVSSIDPPDSSLVAPQMNESTLPPEATDKIIPKKNTPIEQDKKEELYVKIGEWTITDMPSKNNLVAITHIDTVATRTNPTITPAPHLTISCSQEKLSISLKWKHNIHDAKAISNSTRNNYSWRSSGNSDYLLPNKEIYELLNDLTFLNELTISLYSTDSHQTATFNTSNLYSAILKSDKCASKLDNIKL